MAASLSILRHSLDLLLITTVVFILLRFFKGSRAMSLLYGLLLVGVVYLLARLLQLQAQS